MDRCDQLLMSQFREESQRSHMLRLRQADEVAHLFTHDEYMQSLRYWLSLINKSTMSKSEVQSALGTLILVEQTRISLADILMMRFDMTEKGSDETMGTGLEISSMAINVGVDMGDNWGMTIVGREREDIFDRLDSLLKSRDRVRKTNIDSDDVRYYTSNADMPHERRTSEGLSGVQVQRWRSHGYNDPSHVARLSLHGSSTMIARSILQLDEMFASEGGIGAYYGIGGKSDRWANLTHEYLPKDPE